MGKVAFILVSVASFYCLVLGNLSTAPLEVAQLYEANTLPPSSYDGGLTEKCAQLGRVTKENARKAGIVEVIREASAAYGLEGELVSAVMLAESECRVGAKSRSGAMGLMQLMPRTARWLGVHNPYSVRENIFGGAKYFSFLMEQFEGDLKLTVAAYNSGPATVRRFGAVPPYHETRRYVARVLNYYDQLRT